MSSFFHAYFFLFWWDCRGFWGWGGIDSRLGEVFFLGCLGFYRTELCGFYETGLLSGLQGLELFAFVGCFFFRKGGMVEVFGMGMGLRALFFFLFFFGYWWLVFFFGLFCWLPGGFLFLGGGYGKGLFLLCVVLMIWV